eukprot:403352079
MSSNSEAIKRQEEISQKNISSIQPAQNSSSNKIQTILVSNQLKKFGSHKVLLPKNHLIDEKNKSMLQAQNEQKFSVFPSSLGRSAKFLIPSISSIHSNSLNLRFEDSSQNSSPSTQFSQFNSERLIETSSGRSQNNIATSLTILSSSPNTNSQKIKITKKIIPKSKFFKLTETELEQLNQPKIERKVKRLTIEQVALNSINYYDHSQNVQNDLQIQTEVDPDPYLEINQKLLNKNRKMLKCSGLMDIEIQNNEQQGLYLVKKYLNRCEDSDQIHVFEGKQFHLLGMTALWMASKLQDLIPIFLSQVVKDAGHNKYSRDDIISMERDIGKCLEFKLLDLTIYEESMTIMKTFLFEKCKIRLSDKDQKQIFNLVYLTAIANRHNYKISGKTSKLEAIAICTFTLKIIKLIHTLNNENQNYDQTKDVEKFKNQNPHNIKANQIKAMINSFKWNYIINQEHQHKVRQLQEEIETNLLEFEQNNKNLKNMTQNISVYINVRDALLYQQDKQIYQKWNI